MIVLDKSIKKLVVFFLLLSICIPTFSSDREVKSNALKHILVLNSYHQGYSWTDKIMTGVLSVFGARPDVELYIEYMDTKRKADQEYFLQLRDLYKHEYENIRFDVIVSSDDHALDFLLKFRDELYPGTPVFFSGINDFKDDRLSGHELFTGVIEEYDVTGTIDLILELHPEVSLIAVVNDGTKSGIASGKRTERAAESYKDRVEFKYLTNLPEDKLKNALSDLPRDAIVLYITYLLPPNGKPISIKKSTQLVLEASDLPVYAYWDYILGNGVVGGKVVSAYFQGETAALMAQGYLDGEPFENIRVDKNSPNVYMFDYTALRKFNINEGSLPLQSILLNMPPSLFVQYKTIIWSIAIIVTLLVVTIFILLQSIRKRKKAEHALVEKNHLFHNVIDSLQDLIFVKDTGLRTILCNTAYASAVGKSPEELYGYTDIENGWDPQLVRGNPDNDTRGFEQDDKEVLAGKAIHNPSDRANIGDEVRIFDTKKIPLRGTQEGIIGILGIARDSTERIQAEYALKENQAVLLQYQRALLELAKERHDNHDAALNRITAVISEQLHVSRVSIWLLNKDGTALVCKVLYDDGKVSYDEAILESKDYPSYFSAINESGFISADDAHKNPNTIEFSGSYLTPLGITSMLDSPIRIQGKTIGITCCEHTGPKRKWGLEEEDFSRSVSELCAQAFLEIDRKIADEKIQLFARVFSEAHEGVIIADTNKIIIDVNPAFSRITGYSLEESIGQNPGFLSSGKQPPEFFADMWQNINDYGHWQGDIVNCKKSGETYSEFLIISSLKDDKGDVLNYVAIFSDTTQQKAQQAQLQRAQKMDALGKIVGGLAHDYNNILGIISGYAELISMKYGDVDGLSKYIDMIDQAGKRGQNLTKRMLNYSKQESTHSQTVELHSLLKSQKELFEKAVTARIQIIYQLCEFPDFIRLDPSELEDALLNITINAQHAMPDGGTLTFTTKMLHLFKSEAELLGLTENNYLMLSIIDTGCGIDDKIINTIFDPFFSTKGTGGTGLGLSQVYGLMQRIGGIIRVASQKDIGSEFILYFPCYQNKEISDLKSEQDTAAIKQGNAEIILVVDDEPALREFTQEVLRMAGYRVLLAEDGEKAVDMLTKNAVDVVLSDVIMPNMDGYQLAHHIKAHYPGIKIQLTSGFSDDRYDKAKDEVFDKAKLQKPFTSSELLNRIAGLLKEDKNN